MLRLRVITALALAAALALALFLLPPAGLALLFGAVVVAALWEWSNLADLRAPVYRIGYCLAGAGALWALQACTGLLGEAPRAAPLRGLFALAALWWAVALLLVSRFPGGVPLWRHTPTRLLMGLLVLLPAWLALVYLRVQGAGELLILFLIALVAAADIGAYFSGRAFGRRKLAPRVSPGKSWEGFWGGLASALLLALLVWLPLGAGWLPLPALLAIAAATVLASVLGDLLESMFKRQRGIKDSGTLLPGHGGVLDRLDSLSAAAPVFALGLLLVLG